MRIVLATGIYPPAIGGPATYVQALAQELTDMGHNVSVVSYGTTVLTHGNWKVFLVPQNSFLPIRYQRYAQALREQGNNADIVIAFSSVSVGIPLMLAGLKKPKKILRLGGDFFWERYTGRGGMKTLREWHQSTGSWFWRFVMQRILNLFDHVVYSTDMQQDIHEKAYRLPAHSIIHNAVPVDTQTKHQLHTPMKLLFMGRFVGFKNLPALVEAVATMNDVTLTIVGEGSLEAALQAQATKAGGRITFAPSARGEQKREYFDAHDALVLPSITEISPNVALEAAATGLPVLLSADTGLQSLPMLPIVRANMRTADEIRSAINTLRSQYPSGGYEGSVRPIKAVAMDFANLCHSLLRS